MQIKNLIQILLQIIKCRIYRVEQSKHVFDARVTSQSFDNHEKELYSSNRIDRMINRNRKIYFRFWFMQIRSDAWNYFMWNRSRTSRGSGISPCLNGAVFTVIEVARVSKHVFLFVTESIYADLRAMTSCTGRRNIFFDAEFGLDSFLYSIRSSRFLSLRTHPFRCSKCRKYGGSLHVFSHFFELFIFPLFLLERLHVRPFRFKCRKFDKVRAKYGTLVKV